MSHPLIKLVFGVGVVFFVVFFGAGYSARMNERNAIELCQKIERVQVLEKIPELLDEIQKKWFDRQMEKNTGKDSYQMTFLFMDGVPMFDTQTTCAINIENSRVVGTEIY